MQPKLFTIRAYTSADETQWVRCRVLAFLDSAYFDDVACTKHTYATPAIELVAENDQHEIIGLIDIACEEREGSICSDRPGLGGMIWNVGVHPDWRGLGVAARLLAHASSLATSRGVVRLEAWTRDDPKVLAWYRKHGFSRVDHYLHVYLNAEEAKTYLSSSMPELRAVGAFAHVTDPKVFADIRANINRVHDCNLFELRL